MGESNTKIKLTGVKSDGFFSKEISLITKKPAGEIINEPDSDVVGQTNFIERLYAFLTIKKLLGAKSNKNQVSISSTLHKQLLRRYSFDKKLYSQTAIRKKLRKALLYKKSNA